MADNRALYAQLLKRFASNQRDGLLRVGSALSAGARDEAVRHAHTGVAGTIGAAALQASAAALESALRADAGLPDAALTAVDEALQPLVSGIRQRAQAGNAHAGAAPTAEAAVAAVDVGAVGAAPSDLRARLADDDTDAVDSLRAMRRLPGIVLFGAEPDAIERVVGGCDFGSGVAAADRLLARLSARAGVPADQDDPE
jgi:HPt (histidine-containing phosphotransfer) domain-containing protein